jgi:hypothetical protein
LLTIPPIILSNYHFLFSKPSILTIFFFFQRISLDSSDPPISKPKKRKKIQLPHIIDCMIRYTCSLNSVSGSLKGKKTKIRLFRNWVVVLPTVDMFLSERMMRWNQERRMLWYWKYFSCSIWSWKVRSLQFAVCYRINASFQIVLLCFALVSIIFELLNVRSCCNTSTFCHDLSAFVVKQHIEMFSKLFLACSKHPSMPWHSSNFFAIIHRWTFLKIDVLEIEFSFPLCSVYGLFSKFVHIFFFGNSQFTYICLKSDHISQIFILFY